MKNFVQRLAGRIYRLLEHCAQAQREDSYRRAFLVIGDNVELSKAIFSSCDRICIGSHVYLGPGTNLVGRGGITLADHVIVGPEVLIMSSLHNWEKAEWLPYDNMEQLKPVSIGIACWIGARAIIMPGVQLGAGSVVGAGAVVTKDCEPGSVLAGNPARLIKRRDSAQLERCMHSGLFYLKCKEERGIALTDKLETPWNKVHIPSNPSFPDLM